MFKGLSNEANNTTFLGGGSPTLRDLEYDAIEVSELV